MALRLERLRSIQTVLLSQIDILETMTPMDFLEFRHLLVPVSGFQSIQFREIEIKMGLSTSKRFSVDRNYFLGRLSEKNRTYLEKVESQPNLVQGLERWLCRIPFTKAKGFDFWEAYRAAVKQLLNQEGLIVEKETHFQGGEHEAQQHRLAETAATFDQLFDDAA